ncbi:response regulator transcription factor [Candidatus Peregrinibacteria bacterium]|nr:response regulator transcription factor [Candidatus Peregrinibacteria bacterium]
MKILFISNKHEEAKNFFNALKSHNILTDQMDYNQLFSMNEVQEFEYSSIVFSVETTLEIKQFMLFIYQKQIHIPTILLWGATRTIPQSMQGKCTHRLSCCSDYFRTARKIKEIIYSYTVKDFYNKGSDVLKFNGLTLDRRYRHLKLKDQIVTLRNKEFALLEFFMMHPQTLLCRNTILESVWDINKTFMTNTVDVHVGKLRKILGGKGELIKTIHSIGYIFG